MFNDGLGNDVRVRLKVDGVSSSEMQVNDWRLPPTEQGVCDCKREVRFRLEPFAEVGVEVDPRKNRFCRSFSSFSRALLNNKKKVALESISTDLPIVSLTINWINHCALMRALAI